MSAGVKLVTIFLLLRFLGSGQSMIYDGISKVFGKTGSVTNVRTTRLLNQLCNESQDGDSVGRDACYGCFFRASTQPPGYPTLLSMATCADNYLNNTDYGHCRAYLRNATGAVDPRVSPTVIYCTFLECIRQVNKDSLEALESLSRDVAPSSPEAKYISKKGNQLFILWSHLNALRGVCIVRNVDLDSNTIRPGAEPISPRRSNFIDPNVRRGGPDNVFQFFINGRKARPTFRKYDRMYSGEDTMRRYEPDYRGLSAYDRFDNGMIDECAKFRNAQQADWPTVPCMNPTGF